MADIKQAAKWMEEGLRVRRSTHGRLWSVGYNKQAECILSSNARIDKWGRGDEIDDDLLKPEDLLAEDWEIAE